MQCNRMKRSSPLQIFRFITSLPDVNAHIDQKGGKFSVAFSQTVDQTKEIGIPDPQKKITRETMPDSLLNTACALPRPLETRTSYDAHG